jgi:branched-chain amino acid aminotransferase
LYTAPDNMVLSGITRKHVLEICSDNHIPVKMLPVKASRLSDYEAVFMTGTSPMVLAFSSIDDKRFKVRVPMIEKLRQLYISRAEESISVFRVGKSSSGR